MELFTYERLLPLVGQNIAVLHPETGLAQTQLTITQVNKNTAMEPRFDAFTVELQSSAEVHCPQGVYQLSHPDFGQAALLMTPNAADQYHICVSRKKAAS